AGYITEDMFDAVFTAAGHWHPTLGRSPVEWSPITLHQALWFFLGDIPWGRGVAGPDDGAGPNASDRRPRYHVDGRLEVFDISPLKDRARLWSANRRRRVVRSSVMLGLGHRQDFDSNQTVRTELAWQTYPAHSPYRDINRDHFPLVAEFKRVASEGGPLK